VIWFQDCRHPLNRSRKVAAFHTPAAFTELLERDFDSACDGVQQLPNDNPRLRPYQRDANARSNAHRQRKRHMLVAMATVPARRSHL
jgi:type I site-specific restriction endonuclease